MKKIAVTGIVVAGLAALAFLKFSGGQTSSDISKGLDLAPPTMRPQVVDREVQAIRQHNWAEVEKLLADKKSHRPVLSQTLKYLEDPQSRPVHPEIFAVLVKELSAEKSDMSERVRIYRGFSFMNLDKNQQRQVRKAFATNKKDSKVSLAQSFVGSVPFPGDQEKFLVQEISAAVPSRNTEALYVTGFVADPKAKARISTKILSLFPASSMATKPYMAKFLMVHGQDELKQENSYHSFVNFVKKQEGDLWNEVRGLLK